MSTPFAVGAAALLLSVEPDLTTNQLLRWMQRTAVDISEVGNNERYPGITYRVNVGFLLAEWGDTLLGMLGWQAENLVVRLTDFLIGAASERVAVSQALLSEMERAAGELQCEAALLFPPRPAPAALVEFYETLGYEHRVVGDLPKAWQEAAHEGQLEKSDSVLVKKLREKRVLRPM